MFLVLAEGLQSLVVFSSKRQAEVGILWFSLQRFSFAEKSLPEQREVPSSSGMSVQP